MTPANTVAHEQHAKQVSRRMGAFRELGHCHFFTDNWYETRFGSLLMHISPEPTYTKPGHKPSGLDGLMKCLC